jgi:hypothetical protein
MNPRTYILCAAAATMLVATAALRAQDNATNTNAVADAAVTAQATNSASTNASSATEKNPALAAAVAAAAANGELTETPRMDARTFQIISDRNIFSPNRRAPVTQRTGPPPVRTEYFTLNGTMTYENQGYAFFDGSSGQYRRTLGHSESIAGYKIASISNNLVKLAASSNQTITMMVGMQMRKAGDGPWKLETRGETPPDSGSSSGDGSTASADGSPDTTTVSPIFTGAQEDIVKKLMARRAEEEKGGGGGGGGGGDKKDQ